MLISDWSSDVCSSDLPRIGSHAIFCDGSIKLSEALPVLGRGRVVRWLQHEAPIQKQNCIKIATLSQIPGLNVAILTQKIMSTKQRFAVRCPRRTRSEEHTSELQSLMRISYAVFCLKKKKENRTIY